MNFDIPELEIFGVYDRGEPNKERIVLRANLETNLSTYCLVLGFTGGSSNIIFPIADHFLWLGNTIVAKNAWVFIFTGPGMSTVTQEENTKDPAHNIFWNKKNVVLDTLDLTPALLKINTVLIAGVNKNINELVAV